MKIKKEETNIIGQWTFNGSKMIENDQCKRIDWLITHYLKLVATDTTGWLKLYQDPEDGRYWQLNFEQGEMQGGGPPSLIMLIDSEAHAKYDLKK